MRLGAARASAISGKADAPPTSPFLRGRAVTPSPGGRETRHPTSTNIRARVNPTAIDTAATFCRRSAGPLPGIDVETAGDDHVLCPIDQIQKALGIHPGHVSRVQPASGEGPGPVQVTRHQQRPAHAKLAECGYIVIAGGWRMASNISPPTLRGRWS
jgi:hypothetical protein